MVDESLVVRENLYQEPTVNLLGAGRIPNMSLFYATAKWHGNGPGHVFRVYACILSWHAIDSS